MEQCMRLEQNRNVDWYELSDERILVVFKDGSIYMQTGPVGRAEFLGLGRTVTLARRARDLVEMMDGPHAGQVTG